MVGKQLSPVVSVAYPAGPCNWKCGRVPRENPSLAGHEAHCQWVATGFCLILFHFSLILFRFSAIVEDRPGLCHQDVVCRWRRGGSESGMCMRPPLCLKPQFSDRGLDHCRKFAGVVFSRTLPDPAQVSDSGAYRTV